MARIRTIKPEFPQSESMGRVSRESRLCFMLLWTLADDSGRLRGNSRMLASLLYPYDDDAGKLIDGWLGELSKEGCVARYSADGDTYLQICNWLKHQKIDKPSASKIPAFDESSRIVANPLERSSGDQGSRNGSRIKEWNGSEEARAARPAPRKRCPPDFEITPELRSWASEKAPGVDIDRETEAFKDYEYRNGHTDWVACWRTWMRKAKPKVRSAAEKLTWRPGMGDD